MAKRGRPKQDKAIRPVADNVPVRERPFDISDFPQLANSTRAFHNFNTQLEVLRGRKDKEGAKRLLANAGIQRDLLVEWLTSEDFPKDAQEATRALVIDFENFSRTADAFIEGAEHEVEVALRPLEEEKAPDKKGTNALRRSVERMSLRNFEEVAEYSRLLVTAEAAYENLIDNRRKLSGNQARVEFNRIASLVRPSKFAKVSSRLTPEVVQTVNSLYEKYVDAKKRASAVIDDVNTLADMPQPRLELKALLIVLETRARMSEAAQVAQEQMTMESFLEYEKKTQELIQELESALLYLPEGTVAEDQITLLSQITNRQAHDFANNVKSRLKHKESAQARQASRSAKYEAAPVAQVADAIEQETVNHLDHEMLMANLTEISSRPLGASHVDAKNNLDAVLAHYNDAIVENPYYWQLGSDGKIAVPFSERSSVVSSALMNQDIAGDRAIIRNPDELFAAIKLLRKIGDRYLEVALEEQEHMSAQERLTHLQERLQSVSQYLDEHSDHAAVDHVSQQLRDIDAEVSLQMKEILDPSRAVIGITERDILRRSLVSTRRLLGSLKHRLELLAKSEETLPFSGKDTDLLTQLPPAESLSDVQNGAIELVSAEDKSIAQVAEAIEPVRVTDTSATIVPLEREASRTVTVPPEIAPPMQFDEAVAAGSVPAARRQTVRHEVLEMPPASAQDVEGIPASLLSVKKIEKRDYARESLGTNGVIESNKDGLYVPKDGKTGDQHSAEMLGKTYPRIELISPQQERSIILPSQIRTVIPAQERAVVPEKPTFFGRLSGGLKYLAASRWLPSVSESEAWKVHVKGELTPEELGQRELSRFGHAAKITGALVSGLMSYAGVAIVPDALRYVSQSMYTKAEREALIRPIYDLAQAAERKESVKLLEERANKMREKILASKYLTPEKKRELLDRLQGTAQAYAQARASIREKHAKEVARIIEESVKNRVTGLKVSKEAANSALMLAGVSFLRGPAYGVFSLVERWQKVTREVGEGKRSRGKVKALLLDGFRDWARAFTGKEGTNWTERRLSQVQAVGTLARAVGLTAATLEGMPALDAARSLLEAFAQKSELILPQAPVIEAAELAPVVVERASQVAPEIAPEAATIPQGEVTPLVAEIEAIQIPAESVVTGKDGVTFPMYRLVKEHPEVYGYSGNGDEASVDQFARSFVYKIAKRDGFLDKWLLEKGAVGQVAIIPVQEGGVWHASFIDVQTSETLTGQDLLDRKILAPAHT